MECRDGVVGWSGGVQSRCTLEGCAHLPVLLRASLVRTLFVLRAVHLLVGVNIHSKLGLSVNRGVNRDGPVHLLVLRQRSLLPRLRA